MLPMDLHRRFVAIAMAQLFRQFSSFAGVGLIATGVHYALLIGLVELAHTPAPPAMPNEAAATRHAENFGRKDGFIAFPP